jgi:hypothetical protein
LHTRQINRGNLCAFGEKLLDEFAANETCSTGNCDLWSLKRMVVDL